MKNFSTYYEEAAFPVIEARRRPRYLNGEKTDQFDPCLTAIINYEKVDITLAEECKTVTPQQIKAAADAGKPIEMNFYDVEIIIKGKSQWEIQASARASKAEAVSTNSK